MLKKYFAALRRLSNRRNLLVYEMVFALFGLIESEKI